MGRYSGSTISRAETAIAASDSHVAVGVRGAVNVIPFTLTGRQESYFRFEVHKGSVQQIAFSPFSSSIVATAGEDAKVCVTSLPDELKQDGMKTDADASMGGHYKKVELVKWHPTSSNVLVSGSADNTVKLWDVEAQSEWESFGFEAAKPTSLDWNTNGELLLVGCKGSKSFKIIDPRAQDTAQEIKDAFTGSKDISGLWADNHGQILTFGSSNRSKRRIKAWDPKKLDKSVQTVEIDSAAGILLPFYDPDNSIVYITGKGETSVKYYELASSDGAAKLYSLSSAPTKDPHKALAWVPKIGLDVSKCEIARAMRLSQKGEVVPTSYMVPRKSDLFQKDLYPDTYAGIAAQTAAEWKEGKNAAPKLSSMKPGEGAVREKVSLAVKKSPAEYEAEIADLKKQIAELKAKLGE